MPRIPQDDAYYNSPEDGEEYPTVQTEVSLRIAVALENIDRSLRTIAKAQSKRK